MLREEFVEKAAEVHADGARFLRDCACTLVPCCPLGFAGIAFSLERSLVQSEELIKSAARISEGLLRRSSMTKYTPVIEARIKLSGVVLDGSLSQMQTAVENKRAVPPGTRGEVYDGFVRLSKRASEACEAFLVTLDEVRSLVRDGRMPFAVPLPALDFMHTLCADYGAACDKLACGEPAYLPERIDAARSLARCLSFAVASQTGEMQDLDAHTLTARASSGLIPGIPAALFEILLRYENLPACVSPENFGG